jgi:hypothetical protein
MRLTDGGKVKVGRVYGAENASVRDTGKNGGWQITKSDQNGA